MQKGLLLAEGISFASFLRDPITIELNKPARYWGPPIQCDRQGKSLRTQLKKQASTKGEALKSLVICGGIVDS